MAELYVLHCKGPVLNQKDNRCLNALEKSFSDGLKDVIFGKRNQFIDRAENEHYVFVIPIEWDTEMMKDVLRRIFLEAGLIEEGEKTYRLIFITETNALFYCIQRELSESSISNRNNYYYGALKKDKKYALMELQFLSPGNTPSFECYIFKTSNTGLYINGTEMLEPDQVVSVGQIKFDSTNDLKGKLERLLKRKGIVSSSQVESRKDNLILQQIDKRNYQIFLEVLIGIAISHSIDTKVSGFNTDLQCIITYKINS